MRYLVFGLLLGCGEVGDVPPSSSPGETECAVDSDCTAAHTACTASSTCDCVAGYAANASGTCEWSGVISDPGFQAVDSWTGAKVDTTFDDLEMSEPGVARYAGDDLCNLARTTQTITMPTWSRSQPLVAAMSYRATEPSYVGNAPAFGIAGMWQDTVPGLFGGFVRIRTCLGPSQYAPESTAGLGAAVTVSIAPAQPPSMCDDQRSLEIDRFEIVPALPDECPSPGTALNGDAEGDGGWTFYTSGFVGPPLVAAIKDQVGEATTRGVLMFAFDQCATLKAFDRITIPDAREIASPALVFFNKASGNAVQTEVQLGQLTMPTIAATGSAATYKACVPAFMRGGSYEFQASLTLTASCTNPAPEFAESVLDNVRIVDDPSCGTAAVVDPGFESPNALVGASWTPGRSAVVATTTSTSAHNGAGVLQLTASQLCADASWQANVVVPEPAGAGGPALKFFYKAPPRNNYVFDVSSTSPATFLPTLDNLYHQGTFCLDPKLAGRNQAVTFAMAGGSGSCAVTHPPETAFVDDLSVTLDPNCPAM